MGKTQYSGVPTMADRVAKHCGYPVFHQIEKIVRFGGPSSRGCCTAVSGLAKFLEDTVQ